MNVLIVEDELDNLEEMKDYMKAYNSSWNCEICNNPMSAIEKCQSNSFDIALLDIQMPEMTGLELAERLSSLFPRICFIFITAYNHYATEAFEVEAVDYILKPIRQERLNLALSKVHKEVVNRHQANTRIPCAVIQAFGKLEVFSSNTILKWKSHKSEQIFAYLLHQKGKPIHKEVLCQLIWPQYKLQNALVNLQTAMHQLRKNIAEITEEQIFIEYENHHYRLRLEGICYDVDLFRQAYERAFKQTPLSIDLLMVAEQYYTGHYLEEDGWDWALAHQQTLALKYQKLLSVLIDIEMNQNNKEQVLVYLKKWLSLKVHDEMEHYFMWVEKNIGKEEACKLKVSLED